ncbi:MAG TPA: hypothetical protein VMW69_09410, partial [Spirochaetia bacterium]|nr:hypothetical protein [Spirochaetia bacterium]
MRLRPAGIAVFLSLLAFVSTLQAQTATEPSGLGYVDLPAGWHYSAARGAYLNQAEDTGLQVGKGSGAGHGSARSL